MNNSFLNQFDPNIKFSYFCFDRVIIRGYIRFLFFAAGVAKLLKALGFKQMTSGVMRILTDQLNAHIEKVAKQKTIPIHWWPSVGGGTDGAKLDFVKKNYADKWKGKGDHLYCIITDKEPSRTFASREITAKTGKRFHTLYNCRKPVKQYYIYFHDGLLGGPCYLKICSYLPFQCEFYFNGHNAAKLKMDKEGLGYTMRDNAFVEIENRKRFKEIVKELNGRAVQQRIEHWKNLFFKFDKGTYSTRSRHLEHEWYLHQVEVSSNTVFKSARFATSLFERLLDKFQRIGLPDSIARIFSLRSNSRTKSKTFWRQYENNAVIKHWFRRNSIKLYNKTGYFLRTETTINNPPALSICTPMCLKKQTITLSAGLGLHKPAIYLQACLWKGVEANDKFLSCCADVDVSTITEGEHLQFTSPVPDHKGKNIAAPDLRKERQSALARELLKPKYCVHGFKTADILEALPGNFKKSSQIRHELLKLRVRGIVHKNKRKSFYRVTQKGWSVLWVEFTARHHFKNPMISKNFKKEVASVPEQLSKIEEAYALIDKGLTQLTQEVAIAA